MFMLADRNGRVHSLALGIAAISSLLIPGCVAADDTAPSEDSIESTAQAVLPAIPESAHCSWDIQGGYCWTLPPADINPRAGLSRGLLVDGVKGVNEYDTASEFGYTDRKIRANGAYGGKIFLKAIKSSTQSTGSLRVFLENIPIPTNYESGKIQIYVDNDRFTGSSYAGSSEDRVYSVNMRTGQVLVYSPDVTVPAPYLKLLTETVSARVNACTNDKEVSGLQRCSAELSIPLPASAFIKPSAESDPGIGFSISRADNWASFPEDAATLTEKGWTNKYPWRSRNLAQTFIFGKPHGFQMSYMSWNVRRSAIERLAGDFKSVDSYALGFWLGNFAQKSGSPDVVALQEGWNEPMVDEILAAANAARVQSGKPKYYKHGPSGGHLPGTRRMLLEIAEEFMNEEEGTHSGLFTLSTTPAVDQGFHRFSVCKGEDCFKAKGVQYVKLPINQKIAPNGTVMCANPLPEAKQAQECELPPSGDQYVMLFNVHLQASNTELCADETYAKGLANKISEWVTNFGDNLLQPTEMALLQTWAQNYLNCGTSDAEIRRQQLEELNQFILEKTSSGPDAKDRPVLIMGDFNLENVLNRDDALLPEASNEYTTLLKTLRIGPISQPTKPTSDLITRWPTDYDWTITHGDVARNRPDTEMHWSSSHLNSCDAGVPPNCSGTFMGSNDGWATDCGCEFAGKNVGNQRYDYILVRPHMQLDATDYRAPAWTVERVPGEEWASPYPGRNKPLSPPTLSDHKPVVSTLIHAPLRRLPNYQPTWNHSIRFQTTSASGEGCSGDADDKADLVVKTKAYRYSKCTGGKCFLPYTNDYQMGNVCSEAESAELPQDLSCMWNWAWPLFGPQFQTYGLDLRHGMLTQFWDKDVMDNLSDADPLYPFLGNYAQEILDWEGAYCQMLGTESDSDFGRPKMYLFDTHAYSDCSSGKAPYECLSCQPYDVKPQI